MREPTIQSLVTVTASEARSYLDAHGNDELRTAVQLARDRIVLAGGHDEPDEVEIHQALFLLRRARGLAAPSFDAMRVALRGVLAA